MKSVDREFFTPPAIAKIIGSNPDTVLRFIRDGELKASNLGSGVRPRWRISKVDLFEFLDRRSNRQTKIVGEN